MSELEKTPLHAWHVAQGAKMVAFAGYDMPVQYPAGVLKEHLHCRQKAGLFDVSHMGQLRITGDVTKALEWLIPVPIAELAEGRQRYGFFTNETGGIEDDLMLANRGDHIFMVVNASRKAEDIAHLKAHLGASVEIVHDRALLALQGPRAEAVLANLAPETASMRFMDVRTVSLLGFEAWISRSGYTGEDGFEISIPAEHAVALADALIADEAVLPIGLGARDSLRLEAGLCLYGHELDATTSPIEAGLVWAMGKRRLEAGDFLGAARILAEREGAPERKRVGLLPEGRAPMREGVELFASEESSTPIGSITSGGFAPSLSAPVAMGYVSTEYSEQGNELWGELRGKRAKLNVAALPFVPANFKR